MKMKHLLIRTAVLCLMVLSVMLCGFAISAQAAQPPAQPQTMELAPAVLTDEAAGDDTAEIQLMSTDSGKKDVNWTKIILISLGIGLVVSVVVVLIIANGYKNNGKTEPYEFKNKAPLDLKEKEDVLVDVQVTRVRIERDNNN